MDIGPVAPFGGISCAQLTANLSALSCPAAHRNAIPVETLDGELVAWLCPDCDGQLPADWVSPQRRSDELALAHDLNHHGHPLVIVFACPRCAEEETARWER